MFATEDSAVIEVKIRIKCVINEATAAAAPSKWGI